MTESKQTLMMMRSMMNSMENFVKDGKPLLDKLSEQVAAEEVRQKIQLNSLYGVMGSAMRRVPPCGSLLGGCAPSGAFWCRTPSRHKPRTLDHFSWAEIKAINDSGATLRAFGVGDTKDVRLKNGETITLRIIGLFHDKAPDGSRIPITWEMTHYLKDRHAMNDTWTNEGGWAKSDMRKYLREEILPLLPDDLVQVLQTTKKDSTSYGEGSYKTQATYDKLFLLSEWERYGRCFYSACQEGEWYPWYAQEGVSYAKTYPDGSKGWGWSRSQNGSNTAGFCFVTSGGDANYAGASNSNGVAFGLCT